MQHKAAVRLERLQHQRTWNAINREHQQSDKAPAELGPGEFSSRSSDIPSRISQQPPSSAPMAAGGASVGQDAAGLEAQVAKPPARASASSVRQGLMLEDLHLIRSSMSVRANRR